jgi:arylsulfatase
MLDGSAQRAAVLVIGVLVVAAACARDRPGRDIVLVTVDTLRADHLGLYGYPRRTTPNLDHWFADGGVWERAYSTEADTSPSVVSFMSGLLPPEHRVRLFYQLVPEETRLIPDLLPEAYQTAGFVSNIVLTDEAIGIAHRFDHYNDLVDEPAGWQGNPAFFQRNARRTTDAALRWLREERDPNRPLFLWVHYMEPHQPYDPPEDWTFSFTHDDPKPIGIRQLLRAKSYGGIDNALTLVDRYDEEIAYADAQIGRLLDGYAEQFPIDDALLIFTADHGESMMEHKFWFAHGYHVYEEIVRVPLMIRGPGVEPGRRPGPASGIDVAPTVLRFAGAEMPAGSSGLDLRFEAIPENRTVFAEAATLSHWRAAIQLNRKWMVRMEPGERAVVEQRFYDLMADPGELEPKRRFPDREAPKQLLELCRRDPDPGGVPAEAIGRTKGRAPKAAPRATAEQLEQLRGLGYVE